MRIARGQNDFVIENGDAAHGGCAGIGAVIVFPNEFAGLTVEGLKDVGRIVEIDDAIVSDGCCLSSAAFSHGPDPFQLQVLYIVASDLIQRAVVCRMIVATDHQPVTRIGIAKHRVRHMREVLYFTGYGYSSWSCRCAAALASDRCCSGSLCWLCSRDRVDCRFRSCAECLIACDGAVLLKNECNDVDVLLQTQRTRPLRRHRQLHEGQKLLRCPCAPCLQKCCASQRRRVALSAEVRLMTACAIRLIRRPPRTGLFRRVHTWTAAALLTQNDDNAESCGNANQQKISFQIAHASSIAVFI